MCPFPLEWKKNVYLILSHDDIEQYFKTSTIIQHVQMIHQHVFESRGFSNKWAIYKSIEKTPKSTLSLSVKRNVSLLQGDAH